MSVQRSLCILKKKQPLTLRINSVIASTFDRNTNLKIALLKNVSRNLDFDIIHVDIIREPRQKKERSVQRRSKPMSAEVGRLVKSKSSCFHDFFDQIELD